MLHRHQRRPGNAADLVFPVDPDRVLEIKAPEYVELPDDFREVLEVSELEDLPGLQGADLYNSLDDIRKAGLLNLRAKMVATIFENDQNIFSYLTSLTRLRSDRFFANVRKELRDKTINSVNYELFHKVSGLFHTPG